MSDSSFYAFIVGLAIGALVVTVFSLDTYDNSRKCTAAINICELELPRNQHCTVSAVAEVNDE